MRIWRVNSRSCSAEAAALATVTGDDEHLPWEVLGENPWTPQAATPRKAINVEETNFIVKVKMFLLFLLKRDDGNKATNR